MFEISHTDLPCQDLEGMGFGINIAVFWEKPGQLQFPQIPLGCPVTFTSDSLGSEHRGILLCGSSPGPSRMSTYRARLPATPSDRSMACLPPQVMDCLTVWTCFVSHTLPIFRINLVFCFLSLLAYVIS